jgi:DNA-directed RNA polymerase subunit RPC12/RpoP
MTDVNRYEKNVHYEKAKSLLESSDLQAIRYACLELRYFIEAHVYQQLLAGAEDIPRTIIETWQPNKAIKLLSAFDDLADKNLCLDILDSNGKTIETVTYNNIPLKDLTKIYNSLGSYLHLPMPKKLASYTIDKAQVVKILEQLSRLTKGNLIVKKSNYEYFPCGACGQKILYTTHYVNSNESIDCQSDSCRVTHAIKLSDNETSFGSKYVFECSACHNEASVFFSKIEDGYKFKCDHCEKEYMFETILRGMPEEKQS